LITREAALPELHSQHLFDESYVCALRADHPDATATVLSTASRDFPSSPLGMNARTTILAINGRGHF
jgi:DNA-binding transcriptional LysR family regulator